jgi:hypothetical protein
LSIQIQGACLHSDGFLPRRDLRWVWISRFADGAMPNSRRMLWGMRLDTSLGPAEAIGLYKSARFKPIALYYPLPDDIAGWLLFRSLSL